MRLADDGADARASGTADNGSFDALAEECAQYGPACPANEGSFAGTDAALVAVIVAVLAVVVLTVVIPAVVVLTVLVLTVVVLTVTVPAVVVVVVVVVRVAVLSASAAAANAVVERLVVSVIVVVARIPVLGTSGKNADRQQQWRDERSRKLVDHFYHGTWMRNSR